MSGHNIQQLLDFIDSSPSPWHAVLSMEKQLQAKQFLKLEETEKWSLQTGGRYYVIRDASSIIAFVAGEKPLPETGFKIVGAHTDSPGLRIKPNAASKSNNLVRLGVEIYGGPILATFADRDLSLAGQVSYKTNTGKIISQSVCFEQALLRLPNLAIHMNSKVNTDGLKLHKQNELPLILSVAATEQLPQTYFLDLLANKVSIETNQILSWQLNVYDTQKGALWGANNEFYADSQLENLASCYSGLQAMLAEQTLQSGNTLVCAFFDHEEIGSESTKGADGSFLPDTLQRIAWATDTTAEDYQRALAQSFMVSADMAHAYQPSFPNAYEPEHRVMVNQGPVIKSNVNQRYATDSLSEAMFMGWCEQADVPFQKYSHRTGLGCGGTIGPISSAKLGIRTVDVGCPMWAMHSIRESAGVMDINHMINAIGCFFRS